MNTTYEVPQKVAIQIYKSKNYEQFFLIPGNRTIIEKHVRQLMDSMSEEECVSPIQVNEKMEIIDGQHRFTALVRLKKPIHYYIVKGANLKTVQKLNSYTKDWNTMEYVNSYIESGNQNYIAYKEFFDNYKLGHIVSSTLLSGCVLAGNGRGSDDKMFKNGNFKVKDLKDAIVKAEMLLEIKDYCPTYKARSFVWAILKCWNNKDFDWKRFVNKAKYQSKKFVTCSNADQYLEVIEDVYNYNSRREDKLLLRTVK